MNVLITGSTGFVGGFIVEYALQKDWNVYASVRKSSNRQYLTDSRINFFELGFENTATIATALTNFYANHGNIDYVIHNAGITKTTNYKQYELVNYDYTVNFIEALSQSEHHLKKFTYISSMAASAPGLKNSDQLISLDEKGEPVSAYGRSKKKAEKYIEEDCQLPYLILRPVPVFGPRDVDMFTVFDLVNKGLELYVGFNVQKLSFIYVRDLAREIVESTSSSVVNKKYFISDNQAYDGVIFHSKIKKELGKKTLKVKLPLAIVYIVAFFSEMYTKVSGNLSQLNLEKINELKCDNWACDSSLYYNDFKTAPQYTIDEGIAETVKWYKEQNWLK